MSRDQEIDLGYDHFLRYFCWKPDRELNPQYDGIPDIEKAGAIVRHKNKKDESECMSAIRFDTEEVKQVFSHKSCWQVLSWEPLTLNPSLLCLRCGDHGFIRDGKWIPA